MIDAGAWIRTVVEPHGAEMDWGVSSGVVRPLPVGLEICLAER